MKLTKERRAELKALAARTTPGPWTESHSGDFGMAVHEQVLDADGLEVAESVRGSMQCVIRTPEDQHNSNQVRQGRSDFEFIAASRQALPDALADIEELESKLADYIHSTGIGSTLLPDVVPPERAMLNGCGPDATTVLTLPHNQTPEGKIEELEALILDGGVKRLHDAKLALESKLADAVKALEDIKANGYGAWVEHALAKLRAK